MRLVGEAVADFKGEPAEELAEVKIDLPIDAHLPHDYAPGERLRLEAYRRIAGAVDDAEIDAVREELVDRFGSPPPAVDNLLAVARLRVLARRLGLTEIAAAGQHIRFAPVVLPESRQVRLQREYPHSIIKPATSAVLVRRPTTARIGGTPVRDLELLQWVHALLDTVM